ncbi:hypothetical protein Tsubulata_016522 [Turnera subulata]|uniref:Uncharacterized protein n=1 Tax=Turnera subulata TaxID=218843 RepID=A0A9Q0FPB3_9ROSI|nr:hypothetical protein Tsubulata_016522 [Turnera subulata]
MCFIRGSHSALCLEDLLGVEYRQLLVHLPTNLRTSSIRITGNATANTKSHSFRLRGTIPNICARNGTYRIKKCKPNETDMARRSHGLTHGGITARLMSSERALRELNISIATKTERERVEALIFPERKYSHGSDSKLKTLGPAVKGATEKPSQELH